MIHIFTNEITPRVEFAFQLIFKTILNDEVLIYNNVKAFSSLEGVKINYSMNHSIDGLQVKPVALLFETGVHEQFPQSIEWEGIICPYKIDDSIIPFDLFAASFFLVTRYEEYLPCQLDQHQRYISQNSIAAKNNFLEKPVVNFWANQLAVIIEEHFPKMKFKRAEFDYCPTIDIDNAWAFKHKGFVRMSLASIKEMFKGRWLTVQERFAVLFNGKKDPFDNYDYLNALFEQYSFNPKFFILMNNKGKNDRNLSFRNKSFRNLIKSISVNYHLGIHPSYASNRSKIQLKKEINRLNSIAGEEVTISRQHYLKLTFPYTYRNLIEQGIKADFTMGYPDTIGFRAGIATPFLFFDLLENRTTKLTVYPFQVMDVTLFQYKKITPDEAIAAITRIMQETAIVGGLFVSLWHNESLSDEGEWNGWQKVYTEMTILANKLKNQKRA